jgi:hypothetical protein
MLKPGDKNQVGPSGQKDSLFGELILTLAKERPVLRAPPFA